MAPQSPRHSIPAPTARRRRSAKFVQLRCEQFEDRITPALFNVQSPVALGGAKNFGCIANGDFNGDNKTDIVMTNYGTAAPGNNAGGNTISVLLGTGTGTFGSPSNITIGTDQYVSFVAVGDLNGDTKQDLAVVSNNEDSTGVLRIYMGNGSGGFTLSSQGAISTGSSNACWVGIAQMTNGDTNPDVVVCGFGNSDQGQTTVFGNNITVFQGDGTGSVSLINTVSNGLSFIPTALALADFDGDGKMDIAATFPGVPADSTADQPNGFIQLFTGNGAGGFVAGSSFDSGGALPINLQAAYLNGDTLPDLVIANAGNPDANSGFANFGSNSSIGLALNTGGGNFNSLSPLTAGLGVSGSKSVFAVAASDFDLDGKQDLAAIVYGNPLSGANARVLEFKGDGAGGFAADASSPYNTTATDGQYLIAAPLDANTSPDIVYCTAVGTYGVLLNTSAAGVSTTTALQSSVNPSTSGQSVTFTATVTPASGTASGGTVTFFNNSVQIGNPVSLANQQAALSTSSLTVGTHSITATYSGATGFSGSTSTALSQVVNSGSAQTFSFTAAPTTATAGSPFGFTLKALDQSGQVATGYLGTVHFTSSDGQAVLPADYTFVAGDNGVHVFTNSVTLVTAGSQTVTATDTNTSSLTGTSGTIAVSAAAASHFTVSAPATATAGAAFSTTVTAFDSFNNTATGYRGTVHFTSSDGAATLPANYTFAAGDNGVHTFTNGVTLKAAGNQTVTATDTATSSTTGTSGTIAVSAAAASHFSVSAPTTATAGTAINVTVTPLDPFNNVDTAYGGTVHFTSSDGNATLPADSPLSNGTGSFSVTLTTAGSKTITATDTVTSSITGTSNSVAVSAAAATHFAVSAPSGATGGSAFTFTVTAKDPFNNTATGYGGTVHFTSSDGNATLPGDSTLTNGTGSFSATLNTAGSQTLTATDSVTSSITGTSSTILVSAPATHFSVSAPSSATAGSSFSFTVTALDAGNNTAAGYTGTVHFTSSDGNTSLPANTTLSNGVGTFSATLRTAGNQTLTATDTVTSSITGTSNSIAVSAAAATHFTVSAPTSATAGSAFSFTVTALDPFNNTATGYGGTVHFTSGDGNSTLPVNSTLSSGTGSFSATLRTAGSQTLTATDTVTSSITGTSNTITVSAAAATHFTVSAPSSATAGSAFSFTVTAQDPFNNTATGYGGAIHFTSSDGNSTLPANSTLTNGSGSLSATLRTAGNQTLTATDTISSSITGTSNSIAVSAAAATHFTVSAPTTATAGAAFSFTVTALDPFNNTATGYAGTVHFTSTDGSAAPPANSTLSSGTGSFSATLKTAGSQTLTATDTANSSITGTSNSIAVGAAAATHFTVSAPTTATAGAAFSFTVTALDPFNNTATGYAGTVHFTSTDGSAAPPANSTLSSGTGSFSATLKTAGSQTLTATDTVTSSITGTSGPIAVSAAAATHFAVSAPASATAGSAFTFTVMALDPFNNTTTGYGGTVHFTSTDGAATLPANSTLSNGTGSFSATLKTAGSQTLTATDTVTSSITGTSGTVAVSAAAASHFSVSTPAAATAGTAFSATVTALDFFNNVVATYGGTVHFTSSDAQAVLPANYAFNAGDNGVHVFSSGVTLKMVGNQTVTATDLTTSSITGSSGTIAVSAAAATHFVVSTPSSATAGNAVNVTVTAQDSFNNTATGYSGTVHFTSSDGQVVLPANYAFIAGDNGVHTFSSGVTLKTAGNQTVTATDLTTSSITGSSGTIAVSAAAAHHFGVSAPATATAGTAFSAIVTAFDQFNNVVTGYVGTVHITSSDAQAVLPANYPFTAGDNGVHTFSGVTLKQPGNQTVTATDLTTGSITGTSTTITVSVVANHFSVSTLATATAGTALSVTVTALDQLNNVATGYVGTVHFISSDAQAVLPADYTFTAGDNGVHTFPSGVTLTTAGNQTVTATDGAITGNATVTVSPASHPGPTPTGSFDPDVTPFVTVTPSKAKRKGSRFIQKVTLRNTGNFAIPAPLALILDALPKKVNLKRGNGFTTGLGGIGRSPYMLVTLPGGTFVPGTTITMNLIFKAASARKIRYTYRVIFGTLPSA